MTHLYIEQNTGLTEEVNSSIISKLYELAISGDLDETSDLKGRLHSTVARDNHVAYLNEHFEDLTVTADLLYITFADPEVDRVLSNWWGDGTGITSAQMATKTELNFSSVDSITDRKPFINNTSIRTFNELGRFTTIKTIGTQTFERSYIESIDLSNIEYINWAAFTVTHLTGTINLPSIKKLGAGLGAQQGDCFSYTNITNVICGPNLELLGQSVFKNCTSLQTVTGLSNLTSMANECFHGCTSLTSVDLNTNIAFSPNLFTNCSNLETIGSWINDSVSVDRGTFDGCSSLVFPDELTVTFASGKDNYRSFYNCSNLKKVILSGTDIGLGNRTFYGCTDLTEIVNSDKIKYIGRAWAAGTALTGTLDLSGCIGIYPRNNGSEIPTNVDEFYNMQVSKIVLGGWNHAFRDSWSLNNNAAMFNMCPNLTTVDLGEIQQYQGSNNNLIKFPNYRHNSQPHSPLFRQCPNMTTLIIRSNFVLPIMNENDVVQPKDIGGSGVTLYVLDNLVNDYKTAAGWSNIANQIKGISELPS